MVSLIGLSLKEYTYGKPKKLEFLDAMGLGCLVIERLVIKALCVCKKNEHKCLFCKSLMGIFASTQKLLLCFTNHYFWLLFWFQFWKYLCVFVSARRLKLVYNTRDWFSSHVWSSRIFDFLLLYVIWSFLFQSPVLRSTYKESMPFNVLQQV